MYPYAYASWSIISLPLATLLSLSMAYLILSHIRYGFGREALLNLFIALQGRQSRWVREPQLARRLLSSSSSKGVGIERLLSTAAFAPILSLESVGDEQWGRMKERFLHLKGQLPPLELLAQAAEKATLRYLEEEQPIDCPRLVKLILEIMRDWLFGPDGEEISPALVGSIEEWRKEIAIKGKGDPGLKASAVHWIQEQIRKNQRMWEVFGERWGEDETWSLLLQPFFVSPAINITDIGVTLASKEFQEEFTRMSGGEWEWEAPLLQKGGMEKLLLSAINYNHPFPVLERWYPNGLQEEDGKFIVAPNTHVFIPIDQIGRSLCSKQTVSGWSAFGGGKRACGGKEIALTLCSNMFYPLLTHPKGKSKFVPWKNHRYSGRDNDLKETWGETLYQIVLLGKTLWRLIVRGGDENV